MPPVLKRQIALVPVLGLLLAVPMAAYAAGKPASEDQRLDAYVTARMAEGDGASLAAARAYAQAIALDPASPDVASRAYRQAVLAGDRALALKAAHTLDAVSMLPPDGTVLLLGDALVRGKWKEASALLERIEQEGNFAFVVPFMQSWISMKAGPYDPPVVPVAKPYAVFAVRYTEEQLLLQRLALGDAAGAADTYAQARARGTAFGPQQRAAMAVRFYALGRGDLARDLAGDMVSMKGCAATTYAFTPSAGLARLLARLALDLMGQGEPNATLSIARLASFADPADDDARLLVTRAVPTGKAPEPAATKGERGGVRHVLRQLDRRLVLIGLVMLGVELGEGAANSWLSLSVVNGHGGTANAAALMYMVFAVGGVECRQRFGTQLPSLFAHESKDVDIPRRANRALDNHGRFDRLRLFEAGIRLLFGNDRQPLLDQQRAPLTHAVRSDDGKVNPVCDELGGDGHLDDDLRITHFLRVLVRNRRSSLADDLGGCAV